jgi:hypothetical protein
VIVVEQRSIMRWNAGRASSVAEAPGSTRESAFAADAAGLAAIPVWRP